MPHPVVRPIDLLVARIGSELFAMSVTGVEEIIEVGELRQLDRHNELLLGLAPLRDRLLPVYRTDDVLAAALAAPPELVLVLRAGGRRLGVAVDDAEEVVGVLPHEVKRATARGVDERLVRGVVLHAGRLLTLLDIEALAARLAAVPGVEAG